MEMSDLTRSSTSVESELIRSSTSVDSGSVESGRTKKRSQGCGCNWERGLFVFWVGCVLIGSLYAFILKSIEFSKFEVDTQVAIGRPRINELYLHLCFPNEQVFDEDGYRKKNGLNLKLEYNSKKQSESSRKVLMSEVTTRDLLEFTPKLDEIFGSCQLRQTKNDHDSMRTFEGKQCNERFKVIKYLSNTNCCLKLALPLWKGSLQDTDVAFDPFSDGILRSITLNNTLFDRVAAFKAFFTVEASRGYKELKTAPRIDRGYDYNNVTTFYNYFGMRYHVVIENNIKKWPHGTCSEKLSKEEEFAKCLSKETKKNFEKHSPMSLIKDGDDLKILSESDLKDKEWEEKEWKGIVAKCHEMTDHIKECRDVRVITTVDERLAGQDANLTVVELVAADESFEYFHVPKMDIENFLLALGAILSTGFGFSLYTWRGCRWNRSKKDGKCCFFGFRTKTEDKETRRVTQLEDGRQADQLLITQLREDFARQNAELYDQALIRFVGVIDPIRTEMKNLRTELNEKVDRHNVDEIVRRSCRRRY